MLHIQDIESLMNFPNLTSTKIMEIVEIVSSGHFIYSYPYELKVFISKYTKFMNKYYSLNEEK